MNEKAPNRLIYEKSPYLQQHAHNPVNWYPWGEEAFTKATNQDLPIFLSIGYSTCHWCHVMEKESFEDQEVADLLNRSFINIKVDREERPDIDGVYMQVCQLVTGSGGWPLTIIMTPNRIPFFARTYIPKESRIGIVGLKELIPYINSLWKNRREELLRTGEQIINNIKHITIKKETSRVSKESLLEAYERLEQSIDMTFGGFGYAPKFPTAHRLSFILRHWKRTEQSKALEFVEKTLTQMRWGGIYDQIGFGFHRYSTDRRWLVPHFEKMLYDQALLIQVYLETYQATMNPLYSRTVREIIEYINRNLTSDKGGFYSAEDADSEGEEGKFYLWDHQEIEFFLSPKEAETASRYFNIKPSGNFRDEATGSINGRNILHIVDHNLQSTPSDEELENIRRKLFIEREKRVKPFLDDKVLTDWNGLMIASLSRASTTFGEKLYLDMAEKAANFILDNMLKNGTLIHRYRDGQAGIPGFLDDYAFLIWGLIELYEATFKAEYLEQALKINSILIEDFWDRSNKGFYFDSDKAQELPIRRKEINDGAIPSGNSISVFNLLRLGRYTGDPDLEKMASEILDAFSSTINQLPSVNTQALIGLDFMIGPSYEIIIAGEKESIDTKNILKKIYSNYVPNRIILLKTDEIEKVAEYVKNYQSIGGKSTVYVCRNYACELPTTDPEKVLEMLK